MEAGVCELTVFSHRGLSGDKATDRPLLTEENLLSLAARGVRHFDLDLSFTSDDVLLVAHPAAIVQEIGKGHDVFSQSLASLQGAAGADHRPLLQAARLLDLAAQQNLTVALDLKGSDVRPKQHAAHFLVTEALSDIEKCIRDRIPRPEEVRERTYRLEAKAVLAGIIQNAI